MIGSSSIEMKSTVDRRGQRQRRFGAVTASPQPVTWPAVAIPDIRQVNNFPNYNDNTNGTEQHGRAAISRLESIRQAVETNDLPPNPMDDEAAYREEQIQALKNVIRRSHSRSSTTRSSLPKNSNSTIGDLNINSRVGQPQSTHNESQSLNEQITPIVDSITDRFSKEVGSLVLFSGSEKNAQLAGIVFATANQISRRLEASVLVIDCDVEQRATSRSQGPGISEWMQGQISWGDLVQTTPGTMVETVVLGENSMLHSEQDDQIEKTLIALKKNEYDYVLINGGDAHGHWAQQWAASVNGTFLLVSLNRSNQEIAKSAVAQLNHCGARLLGCVVSDSNER